MAVKENQTPNLFWGIVLKSDKRYEQTVEETFHISKACIEPTQTGGKISTVYLEQDTEEFILCNLQLPRNLNETLDLNFSEGEKICFRVEGGGTVHLTGYLVPEEEPMGFMDGDMSDEEMDEEEEESPPKLVKKRKLETEGSPKAEKPIDKLLAASKKIKKDAAKKTPEKLTAEIKQAEAMKKILQSKNEAEDDSSEDDSDDDDDDMDDSQVTTGSSFFDSTLSDEEDDSEDEDEDEEGEEEEEEGGESEDDGEESEESGEDDSEEEKPKTKIGKSKETPKLANKLQQNNAASELLKKEKIDTPKSVNKNRKIDTPVLKKENKPEESTVKSGIQTPKKGDDTPNKKKDKKEKQVLNGSLTNGQTTPMNTKEAKTPGKENNKMNGAVTPKTKDSKMPSKGKELTQTPNKTPKRTLKGGLMVEDLTIGNGPEAKSGKMVGMYYEGRLKSNNKKFDAQKDGKPFRFRLGKGEVIKGWDVGVDGMKVGGKRRLTVPPNMGYGSEGAAPDIPPNAALVFDVECKAVN